MIAALCFGFVFGAVVGAIAAFIQYRIQCND